MRLKLEALHGGASAGDLPFIQKSLLESDPAVQFAARVALEAMPISEWKSYALISGLTPLLALARVGGAEDQPEVLSALRGFPMRELSPAQCLAKLRILQVSLARHGASRNEEWKPLVDELNAHFPSASPELKREIVRVLLRLRTPGAVSKSLQTMTEASSREEELFYVELVRNVKEGGTIADREKFFSWFLPSKDQKPKGKALERYFADVKRAYVDGASYDSYLRNFRGQAIATLTPKERMQLEPLLAKPIVRAQLIPATARQFVRDWKMEDLLPALAQPRTPDLARGRQAFVDAQCLNCHRFGNDGGSIGPELASAASKYNNRDLLEAIIEPSKVINEQYQDHCVFLTDGGISTGRLVSDTDTEVAIETDRVLGTKKKIARSKVESVRPAALSPMPQGLVNILTKEEILDLLAYMRSTRTAGL